MEIIHCESGYIIGQEEGKTYICQLYLVPPAWVEILKDDPRMVVPSSSEVDLTEILGTYERKHPEEF